MNEWDVAQFEQCFQERQNIEITLFDVLKLTKTLLHAAHVVFLYMFDHRRFMVNVFFLMMSCDAF